MKKQVGLFFGSFNPIHLGHIQLADYIYSHSDLDEIWYIVSPRNPLKNSSELIDEKLRLQMIELCIADKKHLKTSDVEFTLPNPSYTINTLNVLSEQNPNIDFTLLIGSDNMQIFDKWRDYDKILTKFRVLVYPRKGYNIVKERFTTMKVLQKAPFFEISSTEIRHLIALNKDTSKWLHPSVLEFIREKELYKEVKRL